MSNVQFTSVTDGDIQNLIVFADGRLLPPVDNTHPNFVRIRDLCFSAMHGEQVDVEHLTSLFDVAKSVAAKFERLSDRVAVKNGVILLDGDPVHGTLQEQILQFLDAGEEFQPLVEFYEKLLTNPLGDVRAGLYTWIAGQRAEGNFTITPEGNILGYKAVEKTAPEWRTDLEEVYVPSRRGEGVVNGIDVPGDKYIEQVPGDVVEMPRSRVLNEPSQMCGDGLHIGTYNYAKTFMGADGTVMLVEFSPRDIVSLPDGNASWKLRVCRYKVIGSVDEPLEVPVWSPEGVAEPEPVVQEFHFTVPATESKVESPFKVGVRVHDEDGDSGVIVDEEDYEGDVLVKFDEGHTDYVYVPHLTLESANKSAFEVGMKVIDLDGDEGIIIAVDPPHGQAMVRYDYEFGECWIYVEDLTVLDSDAIKEGDRVTFKEGSTWGSYSLAGRVGTVGTIHHDGSFCFIQDGRVMTVPFNSVDAAIARGMIHADS